MKIYAKDKDLFLLLKDGPVKLARLVFLSQLGRKRVDQSLRKLTGYGLVDRPERALYKGINPIAVVIHAKGNWRSGRCQDRLSRIARNSQRIKKFFCDQHSLTYISVLRNQGRYVVRTRPEGREGNANLKGTDSDP